MICFFKTYVSAQALPPPLFLGEQAERGSRSRQEAERAEDNAAGRRVLRAAFLVPRLVRHLRAAAVRAS